MDRYVLYNADTPAAVFDVEYSMVKAFVPKVPELLPMQIRSASAEGFMAWLRDRSIDLNTLLHRNLAYELLGSRDKVTLALMTHMFSISDTFTCFREGEFVSRTQICAPEEQSFVSRYVLISSDTSLRGMRVATPNVSTDGSFPKTWEYENGAWWLYKIQSVAATRAEVEISKVLQEIGWDAAEYRYVPNGKTKVRTKNFVGENEFFEPYDSFRYAFRNMSDDEEAVFQNIASMGEEFELAWRRIQLADAFFLNTDRHMRNFGVIRSASTGEVLRLAPNFDNNQALYANPSGKYSDGMLKLYMHGAGEEMKALLRVLVEGAGRVKYFREAVEAAEKLI